MYLVGERTRQRRGCLRGGRGRCRVHEQMYNYKLTRCVKVHKRRDVLVLVSFLKSWTGKKKKATEKGKSRKMGN